MNQNEAIKVLETIKDVYPRYDISKKKAGILIKELVFMDYKRVMEKLSKHIASQPYPPTIREIAGYAQRENNALAQLHIWREQAEDVPVHYKRRFHEYISQLIKEKGI